MNPAQDMGIPSVNPDKLLYHVLFMKHLNLTPITRNFFTISPSHSQTL